jgi:hypothetical protein
MSEEGRELVERLMREEIDAPSGGPGRQTAKGPTPLDEGLPEAGADSPIREEWDIFRREVRGLIAAGEKGRFVLIKAGRPLSVWDTLGDAAQAGELLYGQAPCLVQEIQVFVRPFRAGPHRSCRA